MTEVDALQQELAQAREALATQQRELEQLRFFRELAELKLDGGGTPGPAPDRDEEKARLQRELAHWKEKYRATVDNISVAVLVADFETAYFTEANKAACILFGYSVEEFQLRTGRDLSPPGVHAEVHALSKDINATGRGFHPRLPLQRHDGGLIFCEIRAQVFEVGGQEFLLSLLTDVTNRETDPANLTAELTHTLVRGFSLHVQEAVDESERSLHSLEFATEPRPELAAMRKSLRRLRRTMVDLRSASGQLELDVEEVSVRTVFDEAIHVALPSLRRDGVQIRGRYAPGTPAVLVDHNKLRTALSGMLAWSRTRVEDVEEPVIEVGARERRDMVEGRMWQNGPTLSVEAIRSLFTPFSHPHGLRLAGVKGIIECHGGQLVVTHDDSRGGVALVFRLPTA